MGESTGRTQRIALLDVYRVIAAVSVMLYHLTFNGSRLGKVSVPISFEPLSDWSRYGNFGISFFFLVSGFAIFLMAADSPGTFARRRLVRLYPTFWIAVTITAVFAVFLGSGATRVTWPVYFASLTMFAKSLGYRHVDNVYWTLAYEMAFYASVFAVYLFGGQRWRDAILTTIACAVLIAVAFELRSPLLPSLKVLIYVSFFIGGALVAIIYRRGFSFGHLVLALAICGVITRYQPVALVVGSYLAMLLLTVPAVATLPIPGSFYLGALTYPLYLLHCHVGYMLLNLCATPENKWLALTGIIAVIVGLTVLTQFLVDRWAKDWATSFCKRWIGPPIDRLSEIIGSPLSAPSAQAEASTIEPR